MAAAIGNNYAEGQGRPSNYDSSFDEQAYKLCLLGLTDAEIASFFEVSETTINNWKQAHPSFFESIKKGKQSADAEVADKLFQRACGYSHPEVDIRVVDGQLAMTDIVKHYPPDPTSAIFWLKNRQKNSWRDKVDIENNVKVKNMPAWLQTDEKEDGANG